MTRARVARPLAALLFGAVLFAQPSKRPMTALDQQEMRTASSPAVSPDG